MGMIFLIVVVTHAAYIVSRFGMLACGFILPTVEEVKLLQWKNSWDLIVHKP